MPNFINLVQMLLELKELKKTGPLLNGKKTGMRNVKTGPLLNVPVFSYWVCH